MAPVHNTPRDGSDVFRVFLTGFGPFASHPVNNPSWVAVKPLADAYLPYPYNPAYKIHITAVQIPTSYQSILDTIPLVHARPPTVPSSTSSLPTPTAGYDLVMHCGAGPSDLIRLERKGHKTGYALADAYGEFAPPTAGVGSGEIIRRPQSPAQLYEMSRVGYKILTEGQLRGFPEAYTDSPLEVVNDRLDLVKLRNYLNNEGVKPLVVSDDAGLYCCDYMTYCTMVNSQRTTARTGDGSPCLFMHVPPFGEVYSCERITETIKLVIGWACGNAKVG